MARKNCSNIGGQAELEGVMMRGSDVVATAVRDPKGNIQVESSRFTPPSQKSVFYRIPVIRGVLSFVSSMVTGMKTIMRASEVYGDLGDEEPSKFEKWLAKKLKVDVMTIVTAIGVILGVALSVFLFVIVPQWITQGINKAIESSPMGWGNVSVIGQSILKNLISGAFRITVFILYLLASRLMKDIRRLYQYHGAEHKVISCYESGLELTVENAKKMTTVHDRCGTTFMFIVMVFSIFFCSFLGWQDEMYIRIPIRIACIPVIAGVSYELLKLFAKYDNVFTRICKAPGLLLQKITTSEPDDSMLEVSLTAFKTVLAMQEDKSIPTTKFVTAVTREKCEEEIKSILGEGKENDVRHIMLSASGAKTETEYLAMKRLTSEILDKAVTIANKAKKGMPLQYAEGSACFYGYDFDVDGRVLIPRFDTEILCEQAIKVINTKDSPKVLELCTGSGAVAVTINKETNADVTASDISQEALDVAISNNVKNNANVKFVQSDLFDSIEGQYDVIVINPPYIPSNVIPTLQSEVKDYEPMLALDGGADGLDMYRKIALKYNDYLKVDGVILMEVGIGQAEDVDKLFGGTATMVKDYNNPPIDRVVIIKKNQ